MLNTMYIIIKHWISLFLFLFLFLFCFCYYFLFSLLLSLLHLLLIFLFLFPLLPILIFSPLVFFSFLLSSTPSSQDTLPCYPFTDLDPFVIDSNSEITKRIFFAGNQVNFQDKNILFDAFVWVLFWLLNLVLCFIFTMNYY